VSPLAAAGMEAGEMEAVRAAAAAEQVISSRGGSVLGKKTILKSDHFPGCQNKRLSPQIDGAPNYRQVGRFVGSIGVFRCSLFSSRSRASSSRLHPVINLASSTYLGGWSGGGAQLAASPLLRAAGGFSNLQRRRHSPRSLTEGIVCLVSLSRACFPADFSARALTASFSGVLFFSHNNLSEFPSIHSDSYKMLAWFCYSLSFQTTFANFKFP